MKISKQDLQRMYSLAQDNFVNMTPTDIINNEKFTAMCWLEAVTTVLGIKETLEYEKSPNPQPAEEGY